MCPDLRATAPRVRAPRDGDNLDSVTVEYNHRSATVRLSPDDWARDLPGRPGSSVVLARRGQGEDLARQLTRELLDRLV